MGRITHHTKWGVPQQCLHGCLPQTLSETLERRLRQPSPSPSPDLQDPP